LLLLHEKTEMHFTTERTFSPVYKASASQTQNSSSMEKKRDWIFILSRVSQAMLGRTFASIHLREPRQPIGYNTVNTVNYRPVFPLFPRESRSVRFNKTISLHSVYSMTASYTSVDLLLNSFAAVKKDYFFTKKDYI